MPAFEETADQLDDRLDSFRRARLGQRRSHVESFHVGVESGHLGLGEIQIRHSELARLRKDRVVDIGDVAHHAHLVTEILEPASKEVEGEVGRGVAEVGRVVGRDPADVHADDRGRLERDDRASRRVVQTHAIRLPSGAGWPGLCGAR